MLHPDSLVHQGPVTRPNPSREVALNATAPFELRTSPVMLVD